MSKQASAPLHTTQNIRTAMSQSKVLLSDLRPGDVLLYHGDSFLSSLIRAFDGTEYSHAGIYDGTRIVEAIGEGVVRRAIPVSVDGAKYVDVYRFKTKSGKSIGDEGLPALPVISQINQFASNPERYAYEQLVFLALLATTRKLKVPVLGFVIRNILDSAATLLNKIVAAGKEPVICSELVYRCYQGAGADYKIAIKGADKAANSIAAVAGPKSKVSKEEKEMQASAKRFLAAWNDAQRSTQPEGTVSIKAVADFVSPGDLSKSPNLVKKGRLSLDTDSISALASISFNRGSRRASPPILAGDGSFGFVARIEGDDIVVENVVCTWFGGTDDPQDSGETASGFNTAQNPSFQGCALPMDKHLFPRPFPPCDGSPIPKLPWWIKIEVQRADGSGSPIEVPLLDIGPSKFAASRAAIDLTKPAFVALGGSINGGRIRVNYRVIGGARYAGTGVNSGSVRRSEATSYEGESGAALSISFSGGGGSGAHSGHGTSNPHSKPTIKQFIQSPNYSSRGGASIERIVLHYTAGSTAQGAINTFLDTDRGTSAHYIIDRNGDIYQMVRDSDRAHHCKGANANSIGIEHVAISGQAVTSAQEKSSIALIRWLMGAYGIPASGIDGHRWTPGYSGGVGGTDCPHSLFGHEGDHDAVNDWVSENFGS